MTLRIPKEVQEQISKKIPFSFLPEELKPDDQYVTAPPKRRKHWHKITKEDGLPETESGYWAVNFSERIEKFGPKCFYKRVSLYVPAPCDWFSDWKYVNFNEKYGFYSKKRERIDARLPQRMLRQDVLEWIVLQRGDWWTPPQRHKEIVNWMKDTWSKRPDTRKPWFSPARSLSCARLRTREKRRILKKRYPGQYKRGVRRQKQDGAPLEENGSTPAQDGKPT